MKYAPLYAVLFSLGISLVESFNEMCMTVETLTKNNRDCYVDYLRTHPYPEDPLEWPEGVA